MSTINFRRFALPGTALLLAAALALAAPAAAMAAITVNGNLSDWGVNTGGITGGSGTGIGTTYGDGYVITGPHTGPYYGYYGANINPTNGVYYMIEDSDDSAGNAAPLGPNQGGQNYDAEFIGVKFEGDYVYIAIQTGQRADNGLVYYSPGDILVTMANGDIYGIEVGGGVGSTTDITETSAATTYAINNDGTTKTSGTVSAPNSMGGNTTVSTGDHATRKAGSIWLNPVWLLDPIATVYPSGTGTKDKVQIDHTKTTWDAVGSALEYVYKDWNPTSYSSKNQHAVIELKIDLELFGGIGFNSFQWAPSCGNDQVITLTLGDSGITSTLVPEPSSCCLLAMAGFGFLFARPKRRKVA